MQFLLENIEWIFSGIGVAIVTGVVQVKNKKKEKSNYVIKKSKQTKISRNEIADIKIISCEKTIIEGNKSL